MQSNKSFAANDLDREARIPNAAGQNALPFSISARYKPVATDVFDWEVKMRMQQRMWQFGIVATLVVAATYSEAQIPAGNRVAARVNGEEISLAELQAVLDLRPSPVPLSKELQKEMRKAALDMLLDDLLMRQFLRKAAQPVNPADVQKEYDKLHEALKAQK